MSGLVLVAGIDRQPEHCSDSGVESALPTGPSSHFCFLPLANQVKLQPKERGLASFVVRKLSV